MEVKPGYKQTDVGVIPTEWEVKRLSDVGDIRSGGTPSTAQSHFWNGEVPWCTPTDITGLGGRKYLTNTARTISAAGLQASAAEFIPPRSLIMTSRATIGGCAINLIPMTTNQGFKNVVPFDDVDVECLYYKMTTQKAGLIALCGGSTFLEIGKKQLRGYLIALPRDLPEQRAIATVLSDTDALLESLDGLIAKKRDLKLAARQQLLTGQTRLPGFQGEWEMRRLGDHVTFLRHGVNSRAELLPDGRVRYLHYGEVHACKGVSLSPNGLPCLPEAKATTLDRLLDGDLVFADASEDVVGVSKSVEMEGVGSTEVVSGLHTIAARFDKDILADRFKGFLQFCPTFSAHLRRLAAGTKVYATNRAHVASVEMPLPSVPEQSAIASVLSDMDVELEALEARRDKTRDLKQAMMQELLTGRIRLV